LIELGDPNRSFTNWKKKACPIGASLFCVWRWARDSAIDYNLLILLIINKYKIIYTPIYTPYISGLFTANILPVCPLWTGDTKQINLYDCDAYIYTQKDRYSPFSRCVI